MNHNPGNQKQGLNTRKMGDKQHNTNQGLWVSYYSLIILLIFLLAVFTRLYQLGMRPIHHDESMFAFYSHHFSRTLDYLYQPILHGPTMIYVTGAVFWVLGDSDFTFRFAPALLGIFLLFLIYLLRDKIGKQGIIIALLLALFSPAIMHYSRFYRHDIPFAVVTMLMVLFYLRFYQTRQGKYLFGLVIFTTLLLCIKENSLIFYFTLLTFTMLWLALDVIKGLKIDRKKRRRFQREISDVSSLGRGFLVTLLINCVFWGLLWLIYWRVFESSLRKIDTRQFFSLDAPGHLYVFFLFGFAISFIFFAVIRKIIQSDIGEDKCPVKIYQGVVNNWPYLALALVFSLIMYFLLFTDFLRHVKFFEVPALSPITKKLNIPFNIYEKTFAYWWGQHQQHRIKGPFHFYFVLLLLYELPALIIVLSGVFYNWCQNRVRAFALIIWLALAGIVALAFFNRSLYLEFWDKTFHMTTKWHIFLALSVFALTMALTVVLLWDRQRFKALLVYWSGMSFLIYSYAGEKVPWVTVHIALPLILLAGLYSQEFLASRTYQKRAPLFLVIFGLLLVWNVRNCILLCFYFYDSARERMNYAQTTNDVKLVVSEINRLNNSVEPAKNLPLLIKGEAIWPLRWYFRNYKDWTEFEDPARTKRPVVVMDWPAAKNIDNVKENYHITQYRVRTWWQPKFFEPRIMLGLWRSIQPAHHRSLEDKTIIEDSKQEWMKLIRYLLYREPFDVKNFRWPSWSTTDFAFCVRNDIFEQPEKNPD